MGRCWVEQAGGGGKWLSDDDIGFLRELLEDEGRLVTSVRNQSLLDMANRIILILTSSDWRVAERAGYVHAPAWRAMQIKIQNLFCEVCREPLRGNEGVCSSCREMIVKDLLAIRERLHRQSESCGLSMGRRS